MPDMGITVEIKDKTGLVTLNRPERHNTFNDIMLESLEKATATLKNRLPRVIVITGKGDKTFCAGMDVNPDNFQIRELAKAVENKDTGPAKIFLTRLQNAVHNFTNLPVPIIAAVNGLAYGGGAELAVCCDMRVMDKDTHIRFSEVSLGLMPDWGGGVALTRLVGPSVAADLILTARKIHSSEALALGLINRISKKGNALSCAMDMARAIAKNGPCAVMAALDVIRKSSYMDKKAALALELENAACLIADGECLSGITAFFEKKEAVFPDFKALPENHNKE